MSNASRMKKYKCTAVADFVYDEAVVIPDDDIPAGSKWEDIPRDWECPDCGTSGADLEMVEI